MVSILRHKGCWVFSAALLVGVLGFSAHLWAEDQPTTQPVKAVFKGSPYLLDIDPVTGEKLGEKPVIYLHEGRELRFANEKNLEDLKAEPGKYLPAVDEKMIAQQMPFYALDTCPVSGDKLGGDMGKPIDMIYMNRLVRFCCPGCIKDLKKDPEKYFAKIDEAIIKKQGPAYPLDTCVVSGKKYDPATGKHLEVIVGSRLVRLCCPGCPAVLMKDPLKYLKMLDDVSPKIK